MQLASIFALLAIGGTTYYYYYAQDRATAQVHHTRVRETGSVVLTEENVQKLISELKFHPVTVAEPTLQGINAHHAVNDIVPRGAGFRRIH